jgi:hypothetical protein
MNACVRLSLQRSRFHSKLLWISRSLSSIASTPRNAIINDTPAASSPPGITVPSSITDKFIHGEVLDLSVNLQALRPGDILDIPYELTVSEAMQDFWQSAFHSQDRLQTSTPFARRLGFQDRVLPFGLTLFLATSMTHEDTAKVHVGLGNVQYLWPAFAGDTFTKSFRVKSVRNTSDGNHSVRMNS